MPLLPVITWGGEQFYDCSGIVTPDRYTRPGTDGLAIHHTVAQTEFPDKNANGTSLDEMVAHIKAIDAYHVSKGYDGFGYNAIVFRDGTVCTVGPSAGGRAHVAFENNHLAGLAMAGTFSDEEVPLGMLLGGGRWLAACYRMYGATVVKGHRDWVAPEHQPTWSTACPGDSGASFIGKMTMVRDAILAKSDEAIQIEIRRKIAEALLPNTLTANLQGLAGQIRYLTGGQYC